MRNEIHFVSPVIISCHSVIIVLSPPPPIVSSLSRTPTLQMFTSDGVAAEM